MLEIKNVTAGYGEKIVLEDACACFEKGALTSIVGVNGCGKSTLLKALSGIIPLKKGGITVDGTDLSQMKRKEIAKKLAYLAQGKNTPDMTVFQMVLHGRFPYLDYPRRYSAYDKELAANAIETVGLSEYAHTPLASLSGGMRQSAYIAMALAQDTDYILLDEPTTYLDISHSISLMKLLQRLAKDGKGIIAVMHDLPLAFGFSDKAAVLEAGRFIINGTPENVAISGIIEKSFGIKLHLKDDGGFFYEY